MYACGPEKPNSATDQRKVRLELHGNIQLTQGKQCQGDAGVMCEETRHTGERPTISSNFLVSIVRLS